MRVMVNSTSGGGSFSPNQARAVGVLVATPFVVAAAPGAVAAARATAMASTGIVPGGTEALQFLNSWQRFKWVRFGRPEYIGAAAANVVGAVAFWKYHRHTLSAFVQEKYKDILQDIESVVRPKIDFGHMRSRSGDGPPSLSQRTSKSSRIGTKRRRCKHRNKAGKQCLRPAGHSGRHRFK